MSDTTTQLVMSDSVNTLLNPRAADLKRGGPTVVAITLSDAQVHEISRGLRMLHEAMEFLAEAMAILQEERHKLGVEFRYADTASS